MDQSLKDKIKELYESTPDNVGVGFGKKTVRGKFTGEKCIVFNVEKKKPLSEIPANEILPEYVEVDGVLYKTDVYEVGKIKTKWQQKCDCEDYAEDDPNYPGYGFDHCTDCNSAIYTGCYDWRTTPPANAYFQRPLKGGLKIVARESIAYVDGHWGYEYGTLGFFAVDNETNSIVAVTNNHVIVKNAFYTANRPANNIENELSDAVYQPMPLTFPNIGNVIGKVMRYVPLKTQPYYNQVDAALIAVSASAISMTESFKQYGMSYASPMAFATTAEIDDLLDTDPSIYSSGARSGVKEGLPCEFTISVVNQYSPVSPYRNNGVDTEIKFNKLLQISRLDSDCPCPIPGGDSGSVLIADFDGVWKIIGIMFAGSARVGLACRIDEVASQLNISAWLGETRSTIDLESAQIFTESGYSSEKTKICNGETYWQIGAIKSSEPCT